jgi:hypothetical protein
MKRILFFTIAFLIASPVFCQEDELDKLEKLENNETESPETDEISDSESSSDDEESEDESSSDDENVNVEVGDKIFSVQEDGDETIIKFGRKEYRIVEENDGVAIFRSSGDGHSYHRHKQDRFRGHLGGLELGFNSFLTDFWSTTLEPEDIYFDLNTAKSYYFNFMLPSLNIGFTRYFGLTTSIGINFNKYRFDGNNSINKDENGIIGPQYPEEGITYSKSKLATTYATLPLMLEVQIPLSNPNRTINIGGGVIGAAKLGSHTKVVYYTGGKEKNKEKDDFSLNTFRWGATGRIGYEFVQIYGTCYFTEMFEQGKGPVLYPFEVGIAFTLD